jgi:hypothetical protein
MARQEHRESSIRRLLAIASRIGGVLTQPFRVAHIDVREHFLAEFDSRLLENIGEAPADGNTCVASTGKTSALLAWRKALISFNFDVAWRQEAPSWNRQSGDQENRLQSHFAIVEHPGTDAECGVENRKHPQQMRENTSCHQGHKHCRHEHHAIEH